MSKTGGHPETPRLAAAGIIAAWLESGAFPDRELARVTAGRPFVTEVVFGVIRHLRALRFFRERLAAREPAAPIEAVLLAALYELFFLRDTPAYATLHEAVEVARALSGRPAAAGFVNAVLRRAQREEEALRAALARAPAAVRLSHPDLLLQRWKSRYGEARANALCNWNNDRPPTVLRVLTQRAGVGELIDRAAAAGIKLAAHPARPDLCLTLPRGVAVEDVPGYDEGWFIVQDAATLGAVDLLEPRAGETIVDVCASPGGKTAAIWDRMEGGKGRLVACDLHDDRLKRLRENLERLKIWNIEVVAADATGAERLRTVLTHARAGAPDAMLLDVPCSNTGVLRRRVDARWRFSETRLEQLMEQQAAILAAAAAVVRPGGRIVYSTCSLEPEENERQVQAFLAAHAEFRQEAEFVSFPPVSGMDGAYAARLRRAT